MAGRSSAGAAFAYPAASAARRKSNIDRGGVEVEKDAFAFIVLSLAASCRGNASSSAMFPPFDDNSVTRASYGDVYAGA